MSTREAHIDRGRRVSRQIEAGIGREFRGARLAAGLSQSDVGRAAGMSHGQVSRIERATLDSVTVDQLCRLGSALGLEPAVRVYPVGDPIRDLAHLKLLERLHVRLSPSWRWRTEVPLPGPGDRRAWDAVIADGRTTIGVEAETRLADIQALERRIALKRRDGEVDHMILLVARTLQNRDSITGAGRGLRMTLPIGPRAMLAAVVEGRDPGGSGLIML